MSTIKEYSIDKYNTELVDGSSNGRVSKMYAGTLFLVFNDEFKKDNLDEMFIDKTEHSYFLSRFQRGNIKFDKKENYNIWLKEKYKDTDLANGFYLKDVSVKRLYFCSSIQEIYTYLFLLNWNVFDIKKVLNEKRFAGLKKKLSKAISNKKAEYKANNTDKKSDESVEDFVELVCKEYREKNKSGEINSLRIKAMHEFFIDNRIAKEDYYIENVELIKLNYSDKVRNKFSVKIDLKINIESNIVATVKSIKSVFYSIFQKKYFNEREYYFIPLIKVEPVGDNNSKEEKAS